MSLLLRRRALIATFTKKKSKNLFDINSYGEFKDTMGDPYIDLSIYNVGDVLTISAKSRYIFKISARSGDTAIQQVTGTSMTFTITQSIKDKYHLFIISTKTWVSATKAELLTQEVQLEYGSEATPYEPYI